jgi:hypothetical protein
VPFQLLFAIGMLIASALLSAMLQPKPTKPKPASMEDFDFPQVDEGTPQIVVFGDRWITAWTVLWYGNFRTTAIKSKGGKK